MATNTVIATNITSLNTMRNLSSSNKKKAFIRVGFPQVLG